MQGGDTRGGSAVRAARGRRGLRPGENAHSADASLTARRRCRIIDTSWMQHGCPAPPTGCTRTSATASSPPLRRQRPARRGRHRRGGRRLPDARPRGAAPARGRGHGPAAAQARRAGAARSPPRNGGTCWTPGCWSSCTAALRCSPPATAQRSRGALAGPLPRSRTRPTSRRRRRAMSRPTANFHATIVARRRQPDPDPALRLAARSAAADGRGQPARRRRAGRRRGWPAPSPTTGPSPTPSRPRTPSSTERLTREHIARADRRSAACRDRR